MRIWKTIATERRRCRHGFLMLPRSKHSLRSLSKCLRALCQYGTFAVRIMRECTSVFQSYIVSTHVFLPNVDACDLYSKAHVRGNLARLCHQFRRKGHNHIRLACSLHTSLRQPTLESSHSRHHAVCFVGTTLSQSDYRQEVAWWP